MKHRSIGTCPDCGQDNIKTMPDGMYKGLCEICKHRKQRAKARGVTYIPYVQLEGKEKTRIDNMRKAQAILAKKGKEIEIPTITKTIPVIADNYYQVKAENNSSIAQITVKPITQNTSNPLPSQIDFIKTLNENGYIISEENLEEVLNVLVNTDKLKDMFLIITKHSNQRAMLDLEQALNNIENKLQRIWEFNGFKEEDEIKFKNFLSWRRVLKDTIFFWKTLYQTNCINEIQQIWNEYTGNPNNKIVNNNEENNKE